MSLAHDRSAQPQNLAAVRALLQTVQTPLTAFTALLQTPEQILTELAPVLAVVDFAPLAALTGPAGEPTPTVAQPAHRATAAPPVTQPAVTAARQRPAASLPPATLASTPSSPVASTLAATQPGRSAQSSAPAGAAPKLTPPVFPLQSQPRVAKADLSPAPVLSAASPDLSSPVLSSSSLLPTGEPGQLGRDTTFLAGADPSPTQAATVPMAVSAPLSTPPAVPPLAAMSLLATVVERLLAVPAPVAPVAAPRGGMPPVPVASASAAPPGVELPWPVREQPSVAALAGQSARPSEQLPPTASGASTKPDLSTVLASWPTVGHETGASLPLTPGAGGATPPDAWTLAQLINDVLSEEARRHGVDLS